MSIVLRSFEEQQVHRLHLLTWVNYYKSLSMQFSLLVVMCLPNYHFGCHSNQSNSVFWTKYVYSIVDYSSNISILSINEKLPLTRVHLTQKHIWISLDRELPSVQLSFLWCTILWISTTENGVRHTWMHDTVSVMNTRCFHWVLWKLAKWWWFLKVWACLAVFDGIIETISMAFSRNIFQAYTGIFVFENNVFTFW